MSRTIAYRIVGYGAEFIMVGELMLAKIICQFFCLISPLPIFVQIIKWNVYLHGKISLLFWTSRWSRSEHHLFLARLIHLWLCMYHKLCLRSSNIYDFSKVDKLGIYLYWKFCIFLQNLIDSFSPCKQSITINNCKIVCWPWPYFMCCSHFRYFNRFSCL